MKIYACNISNWSGLAGFEFLSEERKRKAERYMQQKDKVRCIVGGLLMRYAFGHNKPPLYTDYGKPYYENEHCFNLAHSGEFVVLAKSSYDVGIDVEIIKKYPSGVAQKCFTNAEQQWLFENNTQDSFYKIWTAKESIMKATGKGFNLSPTSFQVLPIKDGPHIINTEKWYLYWHNIDGHEICVASRTATNNNDIISLDYEQIIQKISS